VRIMTMNNLLIGLLLTLFLVPILVSVHNYSYYVNNTAAYLQLALCVFLFIKHQLYKELSNKKINRGMWGYLLVLLMIFGGWLYQYIPFQGLYRSWVYLSSIVLYLILLAVAQRDPLFLSTFIRTKQLVIFSVGIFFILFIYFFAEPEMIYSLKAHPPVFRHLRHLNYEIFFGVLIATLCIISNKYRTEQTAMLFVLVFLTAWSGGRGSVLGVLVSLAFLWFFLSATNRKQLMFRLLSLSVVSLIIILLTNRDAILANTLGYSTEYDLDRFSSGRILIWYEAISVVWNEGVIAILTGLGPDAFGRWGLYRLIIQPHNAFVQCFMEFGLLGLVVFIFFITKTVINAVHLLKNSDDQLMQVIAVSFIGGMAFSLVDGIFYHAYPLLMMIFLSATINAQATAIRI
jgi:hypothetical protein